MPLDRQLRAPRALSLAACIAAILSVSCAATIPQSPGTAEDEVLDNIRRQSAGSHVVGDLGLPEEFLRRVADRIVRTSWQERYQIVAGVAWRAPPPPAAWSEPPAVPTFPRRVEPPRLNPVVEGYRIGLPEGRPELRGYRIPLLDRTEDLWPFAAPQPSVGPELVAAANLVARDLDEGLIETTVRVLDQLGVKNWAGAGEIEVELLQSAGLPVDWLAHFEPIAPTALPAPESTEAGRALLVLRELVRLRTAEAEASAAELASRFRFGFLPSREGFRGASESGEYEAGLMRLQLTRGDHWGGPEDGGSVDIARQLVERLPATEFFIGIERRFEPTLQHTAASWAASPGDRIRVLLEDRTVSQWAQDNGKAGTLASDGSERPATLIPRYASRREDGSELIPAESFLQESVAAVGHPVIQSPLLFQGGDLLVARRPVNGERILFLGEAELWRNVALGLDPEQVLTAFRAELGVDHCEVLPSISFHLDFDVSFRAVGAQLLAFVNDPEGAARILAQRGLDALVSSNVLPPEEEAEVRSLLDGGHDREFVARVAGRLVATRGDQGFPGAVIGGFGGGDPSRAVADFQRLLLALDLLAETTLTPTELAEHGHRGAYFRALRRAREARGELRRRLEGLGLRVVAVPSISEGSRSICYLNGVHTRGRYFMSAYGGFYEELDRAAEQVFARALGDAVEIVPVRTAESQRRLGGVHCSVATYPPARGGT